MYRGSKTEEKINSIFILDKMFVNKYKFKISDHSGIEHAIKDWIIIDRFPDDYNRNLLTFIFDTNSIRIHFELDKFIDNEIIVELKNYIELLFINKINKNVLINEDNNTFYFQIEFNNQNEFDKFFEYIVWPFLINNNDFF